MSDVFYKFVVKYSFRILIAGFIIFCAFENISSQIPIGDWTASRLSVLKKHAEPLYRKPTKKELENVAPSSKLSEKYAEFLRQPNSGLIKLIKDEGCAENTKIISADEHCLKYSMPGAGSSFSFRRENYRISSLADLTFTNSTFQALGHLTHALLVNIGDVPLDKVTLQTDGLKFLNEFQPEPNYQKAKFIAEQLVKGIRKGKFFYRRGLYVAENTTFVLRSVAYDGRLYRSVAGVTYNEFDFDDRKDITVAFRIVEKDAEGNVTILWKKLSEKKSPKVDWSKKG